MKKMLALIFFAAGCHPIEMPPEYVYKEIQTSDFVIASWQKITNPAAPYKIYVEGDGYAFNANGKPTNDPTPKGTLMRKLAIGDKNDNVIYLARPCQYIKNPVCAERHWTTARFAPEIINAEYHAVKNIAANNPVILIGFSGGAQIAGLAATIHQDLNVKKIITIAGNLDHLAWTNYHALPALNESMNLESYRQDFAAIPQIHYVGAKDRVIPQILTRHFIGNIAKIIEVKSASHHRGWEEIYPLIWAEN